MAPGAVSLTASAAASVESVASVAGGFTVAMVIHRMRS